MTGYDLSRYFFDWSFENPEKVTPNHIAVYFFAIEHCNRLGWKEKFGFPTEMAKESIGIKSYKTYMTALTDLVDWGFIRMVQKSKNQYSANIIALVKNTKALPKALTKATLKHGSKQVQSTGESISTIDKPITIEPNNLKPITFLLKKETKKILKKNNSEVGEIDLSPFSENFRSHWNNWVDYKKNELKKSFKLLRTQQAAFKHLVELSKSDEFTALKIIQQSVANHWVGLFELKTNQNNGTGKKSVDEAVRDLLNH